MEEKKKSIYFEPESSGAKKEKKEKEKNSEKNKKDNRWLKALVFLAFILIIVFATFWLLRGDSVTSGQYPENIREESLVCESKNIVYEKVNKVDSDNKKLKIDMIFKNENTLSSASLEYTLVYGSDAEAYSADAVSHAQFNLGLQAAGYDSGKFNNKFTRMGNTLVITLNSPKNKDDDLFKNYFMIKNDDELKDPESLKDYQKNYETQGFICSSTIE